MKITRKDYDDAKAKVEKLKTKMEEAQATVKAWDDAGKKYGEPREEDEITAFIVAADGTVEAQTRKKTVQLKKSG